MPRTQARAASAPSLLATLLEHVLVHARRHDVRLEIQKYGGGILCMRDGTADGERSEMGGKRLRCTLTQDVKTRYAERQHAKASHAPDRKKSWREYSCTTPRINTAARRSASGAFGSISC